MTLTAEVRVGRPGPGGRVHPDVYGHFLEQAFFGNIEGGVFDEGSPRSLDGPGPLAGGRADVMQACRDVGIPVVRWPGGNFASAYHWQDGTGPRDRRPRRLELAWGSEESNRFGTAEFLSWCRAVGAEPYLAHSCLDVHDAARWVEYTNHAGDTAMTRLRAADGLPGPVPVRTWGLGNEVYGPWQLGHRAVARYVADAREHARFMRAVDPSLRFVAVGDGPTAWTEAVVSGLGDVAELISLHLYGASRHRLDPTPAEFDAVVAQSVYAEQLIQATSETIARAGGPGTRRPAIAIDEWNVRHLEPAAWPDPEPTSEGGTTPPPDAPGEHPTEPDGWRVNRYSPRTLADALFAAGFFHAVHRSTRLPVPVQMTNTVNLVNANGVLAVRPGGVVRAATYHVFDLYRNHTGPVSLSAQVLGPARTAAVRSGDDRVGGGFVTREVAVPLLDVSPSLSADGRDLHIAVLNRSATEPVRVHLGVTGEPLARTAVARVLGDGVEDLFAANTLEDPDAVALGPPRHVDVAGGQHNFPAHSATVLTFQRGR